jgi:hypothetical protein
MSIIDAVTSSAENKDELGSQASHTFEQIYQLAYERAVDVVPKQTKGRQPFHLATWKNRTNGGLLDSDRQLLGRLYEEANSVLEYGLGESTRIAAHVGVPTFVGIDSDAAWVAQARDASPNHFRFHMGDIGPTREWGFPVGKQQMPVLSLLMDPHFAHAHFSTLTKQNQNLQRVSCSMS